VRSVTSAVLVVVAALGLLAPAHAREAAEGATVRAVASPPLAGGNRHYRGNRPPLAPSPLVKLPPGAVQARGWLLHQLRCMADGYCGRLPELSAFCRPEGSAWLAPVGSGERGWEELPYWLKGLVSLAHVLGDRRLLTEADRWLEGIRGSQRPDGYFGPEANRAANDLWPNMLALWALRTDYEARRDPRTLQTMLRYARWMNSIPEERLLPGSWQKVRGGDNLDILHWLYNETGESWLLDLAARNHRRTDDWTRGVASVHGVNFAQGFREPGQWFQQSRNPADLGAAERNYLAFRRDFGQTPGGMYGADENARPGHTGPRQCAETCAFVEMMLSAEMLLAISGQTRWADRCEEVAYNSLPASMTPDLRALHYLTGPNQVQLDRADKAPMIQNGGDMFSYDPESYRCCQHNAIMGWPYLAERLWMATQRDGLAAVFLAPCAVRAVVASGATATIREETDYPFGEAVRLRMTLDRPARFPLFLRVPGWCSAPRLSLNGRPLRTPARPRGWLQIERTWRTGDRVELTLPMRARLRAWPGNRNTVSVERGPLTYSLRIAERWVRYGGTDRWPKHEVFPASPWNVGLCLTPGQSTDALRFVRRPGPLPAQPFSLAGAPIRVTVPARRIPEWLLEPNGLVGEVQPSPTRSDAPVEHVTLIPMGCARLRISAFPWIGSGPDARRWTAPDVSASASHVCPFDTLAALTDGVLPGSSSDQRIPRFTWWDHRGGEEWVELAFGKPRRLSWCEVYWFDDEPTGGQCRVPDGWRLLVDAGDGWREVRGASGYGVARDAMNRVTFQPVVARRLRLVARLRPGFSGGILELRAGE